MFKDKCRSSTTTTELICLAYRVEIYPVKWIHRPSLTLAPLWVAHSCDSNPEPLGSL